MKNFDQYYRAIVYLESLPKFFGRVEDPSINMRRVRYFLDLLGKPDKDMKVIHITGTAGKGSVAHMVHSSIVNSGRKSGLFTSPYSTTQIEEIQVDDLYIDPISFASIVDSIKEHIEEMKKSVFGSPSIFEVIFAIALLHFKEEEVEWVVLEVGLGGKFDATNIFLNSEITVITNIGLDHTEILGLTLDDVARDKAGIIKKNSTFFTTETSPILQKYFQSVCKDIGATCNILQSVNLDSDEKNKLLAQKITEHIQVDNKYFIKAVADFQLPGRFEIVHGNQIVILDGAHNSIKMKSVVDKLQNFSERKTSLLIAIADGKDVNEILRQIVPKVNKLYVTTFDTHGRQSVSLEEIEKYCKLINANMSINLIKDPVSAFRKAEQEALCDDVILVTGSFFLIEIIRKIFYPEVFILSNRRSK
jgi:dihydrofolate synthase/folylpolyglutamate synthase